MPADVPRCGVDGCNARLAAATPKKRKAKLVRHYREEHPEKYDQFFADDGRGD